MAEQHLLNPSPLDRVADAIREAQRRPHNRMDPARAAIAALKYVDGDDEELLIEIAIRHHMDAVSLSEAIDDYLSRALTTKEETHEP
jgi:hypothetical protein